MTCVGPQYSCSPRAPIGHYGSRCPHADPNLEWLLLIISTVLVTPSASRRSVRHLSYQLQG